MIQDEVRKPHYIPENYSTGINLVGMNFKPRNFAEGCVLAAIFGFIGYLIMNQINFIDIGTKIGLVVSMMGIGLVLGVLGLNDEPLSVFLANRIKWRNKRRTAFYNPRIKDETIPYIYEYESERASLPREKIAAFYRKYKKDLEKKEQEKMLEFQKTNTFDETSMFFKDDEGFVDKPVEYMNSSEYKAYRRNLKKKERIARREEKRQMKLAKKQEKLNRMKGDMENG